MLVRLLSLRTRIGAQPQREMGGLHSLPYHPHQIVAQGIQIRLVTEFLAEKASRVFAVSYFLR